MLSEDKIIEAVHTAMALHASMTGGKRGVSRNGLRMAVTNLGGDESDVNRAMLTSMKLLSARAAMQ